MKLMNLDDVYAESIKDINNQMAISYYDSKGLLRISCSYFYWEKDSDPCEYGNCKKCILLKRIEKMVKRYKKHKYR